MEELIARIAQKARAAGIHLILLPASSVDVITGLIRQTCPRIGFQVSSKLIPEPLDQGGAEQLLGHGDMLYAGARVFRNVFTVPLSQMKRSTGFVTIGASAANYYRKVLDGGSDLMRDARHGRRRR